MTKRAWSVWVWLVVSFLFGARLAWSEGTGVSENVFTLSREQQAVVAEEANRLYSQSLSLDTVERKEYLEQAYEKYQLLAETGQVRPELFFNLGNSALQLERYGRAIAYFEQARRLAPGDRAIVKNLQFARSKLDPEATQSGWTEVSEFNLSCRPLAWWIAIITWCAFWCVVGLQVFKQALAQSSYLWLRGIAAVVFLLAATSLFFSTRYVATFDAVVLSDEIEVRQGDGDVFGSFGSLAGGSRVRVIEQRGEWCKVDVADATSALVGWVREEALLRLRG